MHPFNPFPELLAFSFFAPLAIRVALGLVSISLARRIWKSRTPERPLSTLSASALTLYKLGGLLAILGLYAQVAALALLAAVIVECVALRGRMSPADSDLRFLLGAAALSLLLTGAGALAFDLPL